MREICGRIWIWDWRFAYGWGRSAYGGASMRRKSGESSRPPSAAVQSRPSPTVCARNHRPCSRRLRPRTSTAFIPISDLAHSDLSPPVPLLLPQARSLIKLPSPPPCPPHPAAALRRARSRLPHPSPLTTPSNAFLAYPSSQPRRLLPPLPGPPGARRGRDESDPHW